MLNFKQYLREMDVQSLGGNRESFQTSSSRAQFKDEEGPSPKVLCDWLIAIWSSNGCVGRDDDTDTGNFDCDSWEKLMRQRGCL